MAAVTILSKFFGLAFSALLPLINPLGSALIFLGIIGRAPADLFRDLARRIAISTVLFLAFVELAGKGILAFFGISVPVIQVAGGLVLASMGWNLLNQEEAKSSPVAQDTAKSDQSSFEGMIFYPLTFPVTAGPGCIVVMLTLSANVSASAKDALMDAMAHVGIFLAVVVLSVMVFFCYAYAPRIRDRISPQTAQGILRVTAFVLLCIGVQVTTNGISTMLKRLLKL